MAEFNGFANQFVNKYC